MRIIARKTLRDFWEKPEYSDAEQPLKSWFKVASDADWNAPSSIKSQFATAIFIAGNRVVFNISGNKYRLITRINYEYRVIYIRFVGTHKQYDKIEVDEYKVEIKPIKSERDHKRAIKQIDLLMDSKPGSRDGELLDIMVTLVQAYEEKHHQIEAPDPIAAINFVMEQRGLKRKDLEPCIGSRARVSEVLGHKRPLTLSMIRNLNKALGIPADILIQESYVL